MSAPRGVFAGLVSFLVALAAAAATVSVGYAVTPVSWPPSTGLVLAEVVTGGASASDEFVEIANAAGVAQDLNGTELIYVTASGSTVTRKASFASPLLLAPGQHLLLANGAGMYGPLADVTYTGGMAADGGSLALRHVGGSVVDGVGWGNATNSFVEGSAASAPAARSSIERRPGGAEGNWLDTNDNRADWLVQPNPVPQSLSSAPTPSASSSLSTAAGSEPPTSMPPLAPSPSFQDETASPETTATLEATATIPATEPTATEPPATEPPATEPPASEVPTVAPPSATPEPSATTPATEPPATEPPATEPPASDEPTAPPSATPEGGPPPSASASATPGPRVRSTADARAQPDGTAVTVEGVLTTRLAALEAGRGGFLQDSTGGIAVYLAQVPVEALPAGTRVRVAGTLGDRYDQRTIRVDEGGLVAIGEAALPEPKQLDTGGAGEVDEGIMVAISGTVTNAPDSLADGLGLSVDDGSGPLRVVAAPPAVGGMAIVKGIRVTVVGPLGQRVSGSSPGYRVEVTEPGSIVRLPDASPSPPAGALPTEPTDGSPTPIAAPTPSPSPSPTEPGTDLESIATARTHPAGASVHLAGVVTVAPGVAGTAELLAIEDSSGGIFVRLAGPIEGLEPGRSLEVVGSLAAPYGQLEVREVQWLSLGSQDASPAPIGVRLSDIGEATEASLVMLRGTVDSVRTDSGRLTLAVGDGAVEVRALADPSTGLTRADVARGDVVELTGIVGQRASATGRADGYRLWLRRRSDLVVVPQNRTPAVGTTPAPSEPAVRHDLASALADRGSLVDVDATVTASAGLFDINGPTIVVDDGTAAVAVVLPPEAADLRVGSRIQLIGRVGRWEGGPTVVASQIVLEGDLEATRPLQIAGAPGSDLEWRLVRVCGRIDRLTRAGSRWRMELIVNGQRAIVLGEPGAGISTASLTAGRLAVVTGVVRRSTSDSSVFQLLPRSPLDVRVGPAPEALSGPAPGSTASAAAVDPHASPLIAAAPRVEIGALAGHIGERVTVSGLVADSDGRQATVGDGTGEVRLGGLLAMEAISLLEAGDAIEVAGVVAQDEIGLIVTVDPMSVVTLPGDGSDRSAATWAPVGLRVPGSTESPGIGGVASVHVEAGAGAAAPGVVGAIVLVLLAAVATALAAVRPARRRVRSLVPGLLAAGRRVGHLPRPARPILRLALPFRPSGRTRQPSRREAPEPSEQLAREVRKRG